MRPKDDPLYRALSAAFTIAQEAGSTMAATLDEMMVQRVGELSVETSDSTDREAIGGTAAPPAEEAPAEEVATDDTEEVSGSEDASEAKSEEGGTTEDLSDQEEESSESENGEEGAAEEETSVESASVEETGD